MIHFHYKEDYEGEWKAVAVMRSEGRGLPRSPRRSHSLTHSEELTISDGKKKELVHLCNKGIVPNEY